MRERIEVAARELGYRPSRLPGMMLSGKTGIIAVVVGSFENPFYTATLGAFTRALKAADRQVMLMQVDSDLALDDAVGELETYRVDGVVSALAVSSPEVAEQLDRYQLPIVTLNSIVSSEWVRVVQSDNRAAGVKAANLLHECGAASLAYVAGAPDSLSQMDRQRGFIEGVEALGLGSPRIVDGNYTYEGGWQAGLELAKDDVPQGLFCANDVTAFGVIDALRRTRGLEAGRDYRIIGYDNLSAARWRGYDLTSFDQDVDEMARVAVELLDTPEAGLNPVEVCATLHRRTSC